MALGVVLPLCAGAGRLVLLVWWVGYEPTRDTLRRLGGWQLGVFHLLGRPSAEGVAYAMAVHGVEFVLAAVGLGFLAHLGLGFATMEAVAGGSPPRDAGAI